jgi:23S rRNA (uracil1939-C5)-methyltransferase
MTIMDELRPGSRLELRVDRLSLGGDGVARLPAGRKGPEGVVVFIPYAAPGDLLDVELTEVKSNFTRGRIVRVIEPSPVRTPPPCPYHFNPPSRSEIFCGGCSWQHMNYEFQADAKRQLVEETLERIGGVSDIEVRPTLGMHDPWRYRNKVQQPVGWDGRRVISGFYVPYSHRIMPIDECLVQSELSVRIINRAKALTEQYRLQPYDEDRHQGWLRHVWARTTRSNRALLVFVTRTDEFPRERQVLAALIEEFPELVGIHQNVNPDRTNVILGRRWRKCAGGDYLEETLGTLRFRLTPGSFFQVNALQTEVLYDQAKSLAGRGGTLIDLYCGVGGIALWLAANFKTVVGVDEVRGAVADAQGNAALNRIANARFTAAPAERFLASFRAPEGPGGLTVVLDPPRSGCDPGVLRGLARLRPARVVYVSCDPGTLARDVAILRRGGYQVGTVQPVDLFPHTAHIETVVLLEHLKR